MSVSGKGCFRCQMESWHSTARKATSCQKKLEVPWINSWWEKNHFDPSPGGSYYRRRARGYKIDKTESGILLIHFAGGIFPLYRKLRKQIILTFDNSNCILTSILFLTNKKCVSFYSGQSEINELYFSDQCIAPTFATALPSALYSAVIISWLLLSGHRAGGRVTNERLSERVKLWRLLWFRRF